MERLRALLAVLLCALLAAPAVPAIAQTPAPATHSRQPYQAGELRDDDRILHALNRFTFGAKPGDLEAVRAMGLEKWFAQQLRPDTIDNSASRPISPSSPPCSGTPSNSSSACPATP